MKKYVVIPSAEGARLPAWYDSEAQAEDAAQKFALEDAGAGAKSGIEYAVYEKRSRWGTVTRVERR